MPQAKLPDINTAFVKYRTHGLICIDMKNYAGASASLNGINALLPNDYKIEINSAKYNEALKTKISIICNFCNSEINKNDIKIVNLLNPILIQTLTSNEYQKAWFCPQCKKENYLNKTKMVKYTALKPFYLKVIPEPPRKKDGLQTKNTFHHNYVKWFYNFLEELEYQLGLYRIEYISQLTEIGAMVEDGNEDAD